MKFRMQLSSFRQCYHFFLPLWPFPDRCLHESMPIIVKSVKIKMTMTLSHLSHSIVMIVLCLFAQPITIFPLSLIFVRILLIVIHSLICSFVLFIHSIISAKGRLREGERRRKKQILSFIRSSSPTIHSIFLVDKIFF